MIVWAVIGFIMGAIGIWCYRLHKQQKLHDIQLGHISVALKAISDFECVAAEDLEKLKRDTHDFETSMVEFASVTTRSIELIKGHKTALRPVAAKKVKKGKLN